MSSAVLVWAGLGAAALLAAPADPVVRRVSVLREQGRLLGASSDPADASVRSRRLPVSPSGIAVVAAAAATGVLVALVRGPVVAATAVVITLLVGRCALRAMRSRASARLDEQVLLAVRIAAAELAAGSRPEAALAASAEAAPDRSVVLTDAAAAAAVGGDVAAPLLAEPSFVPLGHAWRVADATGAPLADVLAKVADDAAASRDQRRSVDAALAGPRSSAGLLAVLPLLGVVLGAGMGANPVHFLLDRPPGQLVCLVGVALDALGLLWTQRLTDRALRDRPAR